MGPAAVGVTTTKGSVQVMDFQNAGTAPLTISNYAFTPSEGEFSAESLFCPPVTLDAGQIKRVEVLFFPTGQGKRSFALSLTDNAPGSPHTIQFTGTGVVVPANDYSLIVDPGVVAPVSIAAGGLIHFPVWLLAGPGLGNTSLTIQCSGDHLLCTLDQTTASLNTQGIPTPELKLGSTFRRLLVPH
jgi:hypothetical protein